MLFALFPGFRFTSIVIHHSASEHDNYKSIRAYHKKARGWNDAAYHLILSNGKAGVPLGYLEATKRYQFLAYSVATPKVSCAVFGINICIVGNYDTHPMPSKLQPTVAHAILLLQKKYGIKDDKILFHGKDCGASACPGRHLSKKKIRDWIKTQADQCPEDVKKQQRAVINQAGRVPRMIAGGIGLVFLMIAMRCMFRRK